MAGGEAQDETDRRAARMKGKRWRARTRELIPDNEDYIRAVSERLGHKKMGAHVYGINSLCLLETSNDIRRRAAHVISVAGEMPPKKRDRLFAGEGARLTKHF